MAEIGSWGSNLVFSVNAEKQLPFRNMKRNISARWQLHNINQKKPCTEYVGIEQPSVTLDVTFSAQRGQNPRRYESLLEKACMAGELNYLYVGGKRIGGNKYYIESINTSWDEVWSMGELIRASASITFKEYN